MTENANENLETEVKPFTEGDHEIAYRTDSNPSVASGDATRPAVVAPGHGTGRRVPLAVQAVQLRRSCHVRTQWCSVISLLLSKRELATAAAPSVRHVDVVMR